MPLKKALFRTFFLLAFLTFCYLCGYTSARLTKHWSSQFTAARILSETLNWGLSFQEEGKVPAGTSTMEELAKYQAFYAQDTTEKVLYLTFDCGYENGNTEAILDALKAHQAPATFFVVGSYLSDNPKLVRRMQKEGHNIGNHSFHHPDMTQISSEDDFAKELEDTALLCQEITGERTSPYYRPPQGKYNTHTLQMAKELGYHTIFWSLAYVDWYENDQPSREEAFDKLLNRVHPGAIVLLHNTSSTNASILDELLGKWEDMGYQFGTLDELIGDVGFCKKPTSPINCI